MTGGQPQHRPGAAPATPTLWASASQRRQRPSTEEGMRPMQWANLDELERMRSGATMAAGSGGHA